MNIKLTIMPKKLKKKKTWNTIRSLTKQNQRQECLRTTLWNGC